MALPTQQQGSSAAAAILVTLLQGTIAPQLLADLQGRWWVDALIGPPMVVSTQANGDTVYFQRVREVQGKQAGVGVVHYQDIYFIVDAVSGVARYKTIEPVPKTEYDDCTDSIETLQGQGVFRFYKVLDRSQTKNEILFSAVPVSTGLLQVYRGVYSNGTFTYATVDVTANNTYAAKQALN